MFSNRVNHYQGKLHAFFFASHCIELHFVLLFITSLSLSFCAPRKNTHSDLDAMMVASNLGYPGSEIAIGDTGSNVKKIQTRLEELKYDIDVDGNFDTQTRATVIRYQRDKSLDPDGIVGPITWASLFGKETYHFSQAGVTNAAAAVLSTIAYAEGTHDNYNVRFGNIKFSDLSRHPNSVYCSNGYCSTAAGRYQFIYTTWTGVANALRLKNFQPSGQDSAGIYLIKNRGVTNYASSLTKTDFSRMIYKLAPEWASLPTSSGKSYYGQPSRTIDRLWSEYQSNL